MSTWKVLIVLAVAVTLADSQQLFLNPITQKFYLLNATDIEFNDAVQYCNDRQATMVKVESQEESDWIHDQIGPWSFWLGVEPFPGNSTPSHWLDRSPIIWYNRWYDGRPNLDTNHQCAVAVRHKQGWHLVNCNRKSYVVCEMKQTTYFQIKQLENFLTKSQNYVHSKLDSVKADLVAQLIAIKEQLSEQIMHKNEEIKYKNELINKLTEDLRNEHHRNLELVKEKEKLYQEQLAIVSEKDGRIKEDAITIARQNEELQSERRRNYQLQQEKKNC